VPDPAPPKPPDYLTPEERRKWRAMVAAMPAGMLTRLDADALGRWVRLHFHWRAAEARLAELDRDPDAKQSTVEHWARRADKAAELLARLEDRLGLTPSSRSRLHVSQAEPKRPVGNSLKDPERFFSEARPAADEDEDDPEYFFG